VVIIRKNFGLKVLSLVLAITGWAYFRFASNPVVAAHFNQQISVPVVAANLPVGYIAHFTDKEAVVTVDAKRGEAPVKPEEIKAVLDLSNKAPGVYNVPIALVAPHIVVQSLTPASVSLTIEKIDERSYPLAFHYVGNSQNAIVVGDSHLTPASVLVHGPTGLLSQVASIHVDVPLPPSPQTYDAMVRPVPVNSLGQEIGGLEVAPDLVRVQIQFVAGTGAKTKP
jgi:YbbR domain-containing protein